MSENDNQTVNKKKNKLPIIIGIAVAVIMVILAAIAIVFLVVAAPKRAYNKQLNLGEKYVSEMDYDNAILAYENALDINPKDERAYLELADVYEILADQYLTETNYNPDKAIEYLLMAKNLLDEGNRIIGNPIIKDREKEIEDKIESINEDNSPETAEENESDSEEDRKDKEDNSDDEPQTEGKMTEVDFLNIDEGEFVDGASGGIIIVGKKDENNKYVYGAYDLDGKEIAPMKYQKYKTPNQKGYFVMINGHDGDWGYIYDNYVLYSPKGEIIYQGVYNVLAAKEAYIVCKQDQSVETNAGYAPEYTMEYYSYSGQLLASVKSDSWDGMGVEPAGFYNGKSAVVSESTEYFNQDLKSFLDYELGMVSSDGSINWEDADGIDSNRTDLMTYEEAEAENTRRLKEEYGDNLFFGTAIGDIDDHMYPINSYIDGYMTGTKWGSVAPLEYVLRKDNGKYCVISPWNISLNSDGSLTYNADAYEYEGSLQYYFINNNIAQSSGDKIKYVKYFSDKNGGLFANYGSKMAMQTESDKWILADVSVETGKIDCKVFDYLSLALEKYWLVSKDGKWGYCDHNGNVLKLYDDASGFYNGYAVIIEDNIAYLINENFEKVDTIGEATSSAQIGQVYYIENYDGYKYFVLE